MKGTIRLFLTFNLFFYQQVLAIEESFCPSLTSNETNKLEVITCAKVEKDAEEANKIVFQESGKCVDYLKSCHSNLENGFKHILIMDNREEAVETNISRSEERLEEIINKLNATSDTTLITLIEGINIKRVTQWFNPNVVNKTASEQREVHKSTNITMLIGNIRETDLALTIVAQTSCLQLQKFCPVSISRGISDMALWGLLSAVAVFSITVFCVWISRFNKKHPTESAENSGLHGDDGTNAWESNVDRMSGMGFSSYTLSNHSNIEALGVNARP